MKNIVIFGAPGSGKGTQSEKIVEKYHFAHISTGDVLRAEIAKGSELGKTASDYIEKGQLIPDSLMTDILASVYDSLKDAPGCIFDGFPRTIPQADSLSQLLEERNEKIDAMIELDVPEEELMARLIARGKTSGRSDDNEETIKKRLEVYHNQTSPLMEWFEKAGKRHIVVPHQPGIGLRIPVDQLPNLLEDSENPFFLPKTASDQDKGLQPIALTEKNPRIVRPGKAQPSNCLVHRV